MFSIVRSGWVGYVAVKCRAGAFGPLPAPHPLFVRPFIQSNWAQLLFGHVWSSGVQSRGVVWTRGQKVARPLATPHIEIRSFVHLFGPSFGMQLRFVAVQFRSVGCSVVQGGVRKDPAFPICITRFLVLYS